MKLFARIAQMESSRIVGGSAQTQALLRAPDKTSRTAKTGNTSRPGPGGTVTQTISGAEIIKMPAGSIVSIPRLKPSFEELDPPSPGFYGALMFALPLSIILWILLGLACWGLISVFL